MAKELIYVDEGQSHGQGPDAIKAAGLIFLAAVRGVNPAVGKCDTEDVGEQARYAMENVKAALAAAGATMNDVVRVAIYIKDINDRAPLIRYIVNTSMKINFLHGLRFKLML